MTDLLSDLSERVKALGSDWTKYTVVGSFFLYVLGYLVLRFHLATLGVGTDLGVLDERYLFTGARFLVYLVSCIPNIVLVALPVWAMARTVNRLLPERVRAGAAGWRDRPNLLLVAGIAFAVFMIQLVMRQCFFFSNLLLADTLPVEPAWLVRLLLDDTYLLIYFSALVAACGVPLVILWTLRGDRVPGASGAGRALLGFLAAVQLLLLPINYGVLVADKSLPRVASIAEKALTGGDEGWLVWEGRDGMTFLLRSHDGGRRSLITIPRADASKKIELVGFDQILPKLFPQDTRNRK